MKKKGKITAKLKTLKWNIGMAYTSFSMTYSSLYMKLSKLLNTTPNTSSN